VGPAESQTPWNVVAGDPAQSGPAHTGQPDREGLHHVDTSTQAPPSCRWFAGALAASASQQEPAIDPCQFKDLQWLWKGSYFLADLCNCTRIVWSRTITFGEITRGGRDIFWRGQPTYHKGSHMIWRRATEFSTVMHGEGMYVKGSAMSPCKGSTLASPKFTCNHCQPYDKRYGPHTVCHRPSKFDTVTSGEERVSRMSGTISIPREWGSSNPKLWSLLHAPTRWQDSNQILLWSQYMTWKFSQAGTPPALANFCGTNADT